MHSMGALTGPFIGNKGPSNTMRLLSGKSLLAKTARPCQCTTDSNPHLLVVASRTVNLMPESDANFTHALFPP